MKIIFTREKDGRTLEFGGLNHSYIIDNATKIPAPAELDATGYEFSGAVGGYATAARIKRRAFDLVFTVRERFDDPRGIIALLAQGSAFFAPHDADLNANLFTADFYTDDKEQAEFRLRHGAVSAPFSSPFHDREHFADGSISFIFGDPLLYYIGAGGLSSGGIVDFTLFPMGATPTLVRGRKWNFGAVWTLTGTVWEFPQDGAGGGNVTTVNFNTELPARAAITIDGQIANPQIINATDGSSFSYSGAVSNGQILAVDTDGNVTLDGQPAPGTWSGILTAQNGLNSFVLNSAGANASAKAVISLRGNF